VDAAIIPAADSAVPIARVPVLLAEVRAVA